MAFAAATCTLWFKEGPVAVYGGQVFRQSDILAGYASQWPPFCRGQWYFYGSDRLALVCLHVGALIIRYYTWFWRMALRSTLKQPYSTEQFDILRETLLEWTRSSSAKSQHTIAKIFNPCISLVQHHLTQKFTMPRLLLLLVVSILAIADAYDDAHEDTANRQQKQLRGSVAPPSKEDDDRTILLKRAAESKYHTASGYRHEELKTTTTKKKSVWRFLETESDLDDPKTTEVKSDAANE